MVGILEVYCRGTCLVGAVPARTVPRRHMSLQHRVFLGRNTCLHTFVETPGLARQVRLS